MGASANTGRALAPSCLAKSIRLVQLLAVFGVRARRSVCPSSVRKLLGQAVQLAAQRVVSVDSIQ